MKPVVVISSHWNGRPRYQRVADQVVTHDTVSDIPLLRDAVELFRTDPEKLFNEEVQ